MSQPLSTDQIRQRWIDFFASKGHKHMQADSVVPANDKSVLFTGAGMNQFKDHFAGAAKLDHPQQRAVTVQPCVRAADIENVGRTPSHHACFEMLGNFSFGDYFKKEAIEWAVEFLTDPTVGLGMDPARLSVTVYSGDEKLDLPKDEEAIAAWKRNAPWLEDPRAPGGWRIYEYGEHDNFWPADAPSKGPNGPCGPCSEIYYDMHPSWDTDPSKVPAPEPVASDELRYCEIWNLVFTQYNRKGVGDLEPLPSQNIDTGAGLERMARVLQTKPTNFENDLLFPVVEKVAQLAGKTYGQDPESDRRMRRITDHVRFAIFAIADGISPKNEGRNYVVRRLMRRAILDAQELGIEESIMEPIGTAIIKQMKVGYPTFVERQDALLRLCQEEERAFKHTLEQGRHHFDDVVTRLKQEGQTNISGPEAFKLWDTFGFPLELTIESGKDQGLNVDEAGFQTEMARAKKISQSGSTMSKEIFASGPAADIAKQFAGQQTTFVGYDELEVDGAKVLAIVNNDQVSDSASTGKGIVLLDKTPFYAVSGGQVGDKGYLKIGDIQHAVLDVTKHEGLIFHHVAFNGVLKINDPVTAQVTPEHRIPTLKNHSATHLLQHALREALGEHVEQRGSLVEPDRLRFDFTHFEAVTSDEIASVEASVNTLIQNDFAIDTQLKSLIEARASGARALFGEKYGDEVRVVSMGPSKELCGGTHCKRTGEIGYFRIISESATAAGVRRIFALTGAAAVADARTTDQTLATLASSLKAKRDDIGSRLKALQNEKSTLQRELESLKKKAANSTAGDLLSEAKEVAGTKLLATAIDGADAKTLRATMDGLRKSFMDGAIVLGGTKEGKVALMINLSKSVIERGGHAGNLLKGIAPIVGGKGGGKAEMAQGGGKDPERLSEALESVEAILAEMLDGK